ncbi:hypothetical protein [Streptomyces oceani]|uniref:Uncharacterized protein n=1 Tax=Streptomyces oceani TaxID=1075402 RepID=A0A1E7JYS4_9ACTN|nr:hypothetical protein [Streptomyces oceani]OEU96863.1 hypothetical protein AN216_18035 [Streptomyces oceani]
MDIDWAALGEVFGVSLVATVALVGVFTLGIIGAGRKPSSGGTPVLARTGAYACFGVCGLAVIYGIYLIAA